MHTGCVGRYALAMRSALALLALLLLTPQAGADEAQRIEAAAVLAQQIDAARAAHDKDALAAALPKVAPLHNALEDAQARKRLQAAVGDVLDGAALALSSRTAAADVLADLHDERAWLQLKRQWPAPDTESATPVHVRVVVAAGKVAAPGSVDDLVDLLKRARDPHLVETSLTALGAFGWAKNRVKVLDELGSTIPWVEGSGAAGARGGKVSPETAALWRRLGPTLLVALNTLTGRNEPTLAAWSAPLKEHKRRLETLFTRERE